MNTVDLHYVAVAPHPLRNDCDVTVSLVSVPAIGRYVVHSGRMSDATNDASVYECTRAATAAWLDEITLCENMLADEARAAIARSILRKVGK